MTLSVMELRVGSSTVLPDLGDITTVVTVMMLEFNVRQLVCRAVL